MQQSLCRSAVRRKIFHEVKQMGAEWTFYARTGIAKLLRLSADVLQSPFHRIAAALITGHNRGRLHARW
jgi:hypothetical protein